jgi:Arc/MetJ family transcription regulator
MSDDHADQAADAPTHSRRTTSIRFTPYDEQLIARAMEKAGTNKKTEALRAALKHFVGDAGSPKSSQHLRTMLRDMVRAEVTRQLKTRET